MQKNNHFLIKQTLNLPRYAKQVLAIFSDSALCVIATWIAFYLRLDKAVVLQGNSLWAAIISIVLWQILRCLLVVLIATVEENQSSQHIMEIYSPNIQALMRKASLLIKFPLLN